MRIESLALAAIAAAIALPALADELNLPARKPGEWKIDMSIAGHPMSTEQCIDADTDKAMMQSGFAQVGSKCSGISQSQSGATITIDATCTLGAKTTKTHTVVNGDFQSAYTVDVIADATGGPPSMPKHSEIKQTVTWVGACPAGTQPGDMTLPNGMKINMQQMLQKPAG